MDTNLKLIFGPSQTRRRNRFESIAWLYGGYGRTGSVSEIGGRGVGAVVSSEYVWEMGCRYLPYLSVNLLFSSCKHYANDAGRGTVQYLPEWFPGAGFKRVAREWSKNAGDIAEVPHLFVKRKMVRFSVLILLLF